MKVAIWLMLLAIFCELVVIHIDLTTLMHK